MALFDSLSKSIGEMGAELKSTTRAISRQVLEAGTSSSRKPSKQFDAPPRLKRKSAQALDQTTKDALLKALPEAYYRAEFNAVLFELQRLPDKFHKDRLEEVMETRSAVLEVMTEMLSAHVMANYALFVQGITAVAAMGRQLEAAYIGSKEARFELALAQQGVERNLHVLDQTRRKQFLENVVNLLSKLQAAYALEDSVREAHKNTHYAEAFWLFAQECKSLEGMRALSVAQQMTADMGRLYDDCIAHLEKVLHQCCGAFDPDVYIKVMEGYMFLDNTSGLGNEAIASFGDIMNKRITEAARAILQCNTQLQPRAQSVNSMHEAVRLSPSSQFCACLMKVLAVIFDLLVSHHRMVRWHESELQHHAHQLRQLQDEIGQLHSRQAAPVNIHGSPTAPPVCTNGSSAMAPTHAPGMGMNGGSAAAIGPGHVTAPAELCTSAGPHTQGVDLRHEQEQAWSAALQCVHAALIAGQHFIWEEGARQIGLLLSCPQAYEGNNLLTVLRSVRQMTAAGQSFSPNNPFTLHMLTAKQVQAVWNGRHAANMDALHKQLEKDLWRKLPAVPPGALDSSSSSATCGMLDIGCTFDAWVAAGNPFAPPPDLPISAGQPPAGATFTTGATASGKILDQPPAAMTRASMTVKQWMQEYCELMQLLRPATYAFCGVCQLFELYLLHAFHTFSDVSISDVILQPQSKAAAAVPMRLAGTLKRVLENSISAFRASFVQATLVSTGADDEDANMGSSMGDSIDAALQRLKEAHPFIAKKAALPASFTREAGAGRAPSLDGRRASHSYSGPAGLLEARAVASSASARQDARATAVSNSGNMWGLQERTVAVESLMALVAELKAVKPTLQKLLPPEDVSVMEKFFSRTVGSAEDVADVVLRAGARLNLRIKGMVEHIGGADYDLQEPPAAGLPWVAELLEQVAMLRDCLAQVSSLAPATLHKLWRHAIALVAEVLLEGFAHVKGRCSMAGRNAMSNDLQEVVDGLTALVPREPAMRTCIDANVRLVDAYIKAFFIPKDDELKSWIESHPAYTKFQMLALAKCIADLRGMKKKEKAALMSMVEGCFGPAT